MIWISRIITNNYKALQGEQVFNFGKGLTFFVGENNTGKTSVFQSVDFLLSGLPKDKKEVDIKNKNCNATDELSVTLDLKGDLNEAIEGFSEIKYKAYVFEDAGEQTLRLKRSSIVQNITQASKPVELNINKLSIWNNDEEQYENPSGIDKTFKLLETQFVWSNIDPNDVVDFGSTKTCGKLMGEVFSDFRKTDKWTEFEQSHKATFHGAGSLDEKANEVGEEIKSIFAEQYGEVDIRFSFPFPDPANFFKNVDLNINDGHDTKLEDKGSGMQRGIALAIIQVYAKRLTRHATDLALIKPLFFFIDEPEISLHPKAQLILMESLKSISQTQQVFITTHSPVTLKTYDTNTGKMFLFVREAAGISVVDSEELNLFDWSPSWGEIMYSAFYTPTEEFHNELYGAIQENHSQFTIASMEGFLSSKGVTINTDWVKISKGVTQPSEKVSMMTFIRNTIHHPENKKNLDYTPDQLKESIEEMLKHL
jgi:hypothetical protein